MSKPAFSFPSKEDQQKLITMDQKRRKDAINNQISFISNKFDPYFKLGMGLILVAANTGGGKSTTAANILAHFIDTDTHGDKKALVITNEETSEDVFSRVSCLMLQKSWSDLRKGLLSDSDNALIERMNNQMLDRIIVIPQNWEGYNMSRLEDVVEVLEEVKRKEKNLALVLIDYLQAINDSSKISNSWEISKKLGSYLKSYGSETRVPVIIFAQLKPASESLNFSDRIQNDKTFANHASTVIEIRSDLVAQTTEFIFHKDRWGDFQGKSLKLQFHQGAFRPMAKNKEIHNRMQGNPPFIVGSSDENSEK